MRPDAEDPPRPFAGGGPVLVPGLFFLTLLLGLAVPAARAAEFRDPEGRFVIAVPEGFQQVDRRVLEAKLEELRRAGMAPPSYAAAFDRGAEPRLGYPYALLEVTPIPDAAWTAEDLEALLGQLKTGQAAREVAATLERLGLGALLRDPRLTFVRWEADRQAAVYQIETEARGITVKGVGRLFFYRKGYLGFWFYYLAGTPYAEVSERFTASLTVLPGHRVPPGEWPTAGARRFLGLVLVGGAILGGVGLIVWRIRRRGGSRAAAALPLALWLAGSLAGCATGAKAQEQGQVRPGSLRCAPSGYGTVACY